MLHHYQRQYPHTASCREPQLSDWGAQLILAVVVDLAALANCWAALSSCASKAKSWSMRELSTSSALARSVFRHTHTKLSYRCKQQQQQAPIDSSQLLQALHNPAVNQCKLDTAVRCTKSSCAAGSSSNLVWCRHSCSTQTCVSAISWLWELTVAVVASLLIILLNWSSCPGST